MSFFNYQHNPHPGTKPIEPKQEEEKPKERIDPKMVILEGPDLVKVIEDNPDVPVGKVDRYVVFFDAWQPVNYDPKTGEMT